MKNAEDLYWMFRHSHPIGKFTASKVSQSIHVHISKAHILIAFAEAVGLIRYSTKDEGFVHSEDT